MTTSLEKWAEANAPGEKMFWREPALRQFEDFQELAREFGPMSVVGTHTSKSIKLPVVEVVRPEGSFLLRGNFYTIDVCTLWGFAPDLTYEQVYGEPKDADWYCAEMKKKREYTYRGWTDEEMADPRILRVQVESLSGRSYWKEIKGEEKDRWIRRWDSTEWYERDWSSGRLFVEGEMGPDAKFYIAPHAFAEGIARALNDRADKEGWVGAMASCYALEPWQPGKKRFTLSYPDMKTAGQLMFRVCHAEAVGGQR